MTEQEAIERLIQILEECTSDENAVCYVTDYDEIPLRLAIKSLEKQIPRELTNIRKVKQYDGYDMGNCPICGEPLDNSLYENLKYCFMCGQAIKWE